MKIKKEKRKKKKKRNHSTPKSLTEKACKFPTHFSNQIPHIVNPKHNNKKTPTTTFKKLATHDGEHKQVFDPGVKPKKGSSDEPRSGPLGFGSLSVALLQQRVLDLGLRRIGVS